MTTDRARRKLAAIIHADVMDYSRLMNDDEEATVRTLNDYKDAMGDILTSHRGSLVDSAGDGFLLTFQSVVDAVDCAVRFQEEIRSRNEKLPAGRKMQFRIGINLGDVIEEEGRVYGDGVNIAARLENLAEPGGICVSSAAYDQVKNRPGPEFEDIGDHRVKNIPEPVRAYRVLTESREPLDGIMSNGRSKRKRYLFPALVILAIISIPFVYEHIQRHHTIKDRRASLERHILIPPDGPSIAVLPFTNMSGDPSKDYFCDGMTDVIITGLAKIPKLFVIARNSTFAFKGKAVNMQEVGKRLGVKYVLEGSVHKAHDRVRINARLVEAATGHNLWAEQYDRDISDIFALQDEIRQKIVLEMQVKLTEGEQVRLRQEQAPTSNIEAYEKVLQGEQHYNRSDKDSNHLARQLFEQAVALDPRYAQAYSWLAWTHLMDLWWGWTESAEESAAKAEAAAQKALDLNERVDFTRIIMSRIRLQKRQYDAAIEEARLAVRLSPNGADALAVLGMVLEYADRPEEALVNIKKAIRLNPTPPVWYYQFLGWAYRDLGRYDEAIDALEKGLNLQPNNSGIHMSLAGVYGLTGRWDKARAEAKEVLKLNPDFSLERHMKYLPFKNAERAKQISEALRTAGLK